MSLPRIASVVVLIGAFGLVVACGSDGASRTNTGTDAGGGGASGSAGTGGASGSGGGSSSGGAAGAGTGGSTGGTGGGVIGTGGLSDSGTDAATDGPCVVITHVLATVPPGGGTKCSFEINTSHTPGLVNVHLNNGWGLVCDVGSKSGCGSTNSLAGWWLEGPNTIALCNAACTSFYSQPTGELTVRLGCPTVGCN